MEDTKSLSQLAYQYFDAWAKKDLASLSTQFAEEVVLLDWEVLASGKEKVLEANQRIFETFKKLAINVCKISCSENTVFAQIEILADEAIIPVVDVLEFNSAGKVKKVRAYRGN